MLEPQIMAFEIWAIVLRAVVMYCLTVCFLYFDYIASVYKYVLLITYSGVYTYENIHAIVPAIFVTY